MSNRPHAHGPVPNAAREESLKYAQAMQSWAVAQQILILAHSTYALADYLEEAEKRPRILAGATALIAQAAVRAGVTKVGHLPVPAAAV